MKIPTESIPMSKEEREDTICNLEAEIICAPIDEFILAMREDVDATNDEIILSVLKELKYKL